MKKYLYFLAVLLLMATGQSCSDDSDSPQEPVEETEETTTTTFEPKLAVTIPLTDKEKAMVSSLNQFFFKVFYISSVLEAENGQLDYADKSAMMSPLSLSYALGMLQSGAEGSTRREILSAMGLKSCSTDEVNDLFAKLIEWLPRVDTTATLQVANAVFTNSDHNVTLLNSFSQQMQDYYQAETFGIPYSDPSSVAAINQWCSTHTGGLIPEIVEELPQGIMDILNAIYLKAQWKKPFAEAQTLVAPFYNAQEKASNVMMMHQVSQMGYASHNSYNAISMPFASENLRFVVLLPHTQQIYDYYGMLEEIQHKGIEDALTFKKTHYVNLSLPQFETNDSFDNLVSTMQQLGMISAFNPEAARLSKMVANTGIYVSSIRQKTSISIKEAGLKAAAVTIVEMKEGASPYKESELIGFNADHPFIYCITEQSTGLILFIGRYAGEE